MSIFDRLDRITSRAVDRMNAIAFVLTPQRATPNGRPGVDPTRVIVSGKGVFDYLSTEYGVQLGVRKSYREANDLRALQAGRDPQLSIDRKYFPIGMEEPKQGDVVSFPDNPELPKFDVITSQRDGLSRLVLMLAHRGAQG
ncbi:hypothetical protein EHS39_09125 [Ensifer sp. MPMI2T]|nr:hypothetical protein EHS39_09125 [Ensifer sp. MPMI2T]